MTTTEEKVRIDIEAFITLGEEIVGGLKLDMNIPVTAEPGDADFKKKFKPVSDIQDISSKYYYVNLVQEGGGVLGIALLGYIYVLERMGIRFLKLAGTSAGSIISMMLSIIRPASQDMIKSPIMLYYLLNQDLFEFVDGNPIAQWLIKSAIGSEPAKKTIVEAGTTTDSSRAPNPDSEQPTVRTQTYQNFLIRLINSAFSLLLMSLFLVLVSSLLLWHDAESYVKLALGIVLALIIAYLLFRQKTFDLRVLSDYIRHSGSLIAGGILAVLGVCYVLIAYVTDVSLQLFLELSPLAGLMIYSIFLAYRPSHLRFVQWLVSIILGIELLGGWLNKIWGITFDPRALPFLWHWLGVAPGARVAWLFTTRALQSPYFFLSAAGIALLFLFIILISSISSFLLVSFSQSHLGINPGDKFKSWLANLLADGAVASVQEPITIKLANSHILHIFNAANGIMNLRDYESHLNKNKPDIKYVGDDHKNTNVDDLINYNPEDPSVTFIAAEVVTQNKIEFPRMWQLFWANMENVNPASFIRASMSIPVFFEAYKIEKIPRRDSGQQDSYWKTLLGFGGSVPENAIFLDGGTMSNFPINIFYKPGRESPRLPTFGIRLRDANDASSADINSLAKLLYTMFSNSKNYFDKAFLITHPMYNQCIGEIDARHISWLDFNMPLDKQKELFQLGAYEAANFLKAFDWDKYKQARKLARS